MINFINHVLLYLIYLSLSFFRDSIWLVFDYVPVFFYLVYYSSPVLNFLVLSRVIGTAAKNKEKNMHIERLVSLAVIRCR